MRKEIFFAILAGGAFGLLIAYGAWKLNSSIKPQNKEMVTLSPSPAAANVLSTGDFKILITKPNEKQVLTQTPVTITGATIPSTYVVVSGIDNDEIVDSGAAGGFEAKLDTEGGVNQILISAFKDTGEEVDANLNLIYSSQFSLDNSQSIEPESYIGTVTDITDSIIQIKNDKGDIQQITSSEDADYIKLTDNTSKTITQADVAIGDFLVAMGYKGNNNILDSSRILVTDKIEKITRKAFMGIAKLTNKANTITLKNPKTNEEIAITEGDADFSDIKDGDKVIAVGEFSDNSIEARTVRILK
jgi:hypothetical protein